MEIVRKLLQSLGRKIKEAGGTAYDNVPEAAVVKELKRYDNEEPVQKEEVQEADESKNKVNFAIMENDKF